MQNVLQKKYLYTGNENTSQKPSQQSAPTEYQKTDLDRSLATSGVAKLVLTESATSTLKIGA